jgi:Uma2 family endonuclease
VCILPESDERIVTKPPRVCVEILSPEDTMRATLEKVRDYFNSGAPCVWIVDPATRLAYICTPGQMIEATDGTLRAPGTDIAVPLAELFEA